MEKQEEEITLNNKPITESQLEQKKEELKEQPGTKIVEVKKNSFRIKING